jgi:hypothetical protein
MTRSDRSDEALDELERTESAWLLARDADPRAAPPSLEIGAEYAELEGMLASLPSDQPDESWQDDVLRAATAGDPQRLARWRTTTARWGLAAALAAAAVAVVWLVLPRALDGTAGRRAGAPVLAELEVAIRHVATSRSGSGEPVVGDKLVVTARPRGRYDLRIYRSDGKRLTTCPGDPECKAGPHGAQTIEITLDAPVQYQVTLVDDLSDALPDGSLDVYVDAARAANARIHMVPPIAVH